MTLSSSLSAGIAGLQANATRLAVISDNIANSATAGYRRGDVEFSSLVLPSTGGSYAAGGVRVASFRDVANPGTLIGTTNATDIAISGRGFLPVTPESAVGLPAGQRPFLLSATGSFSRTDDGFLVTRSGLALTGWPTDATGATPDGLVRDGPGSLVPIRLTPFLTTAEATTLVELGVNLPADATEAGAAGDPYTATVEYFDAIGRNHRLDVVFTPTVPATGTSDSWTISFFDSAGDPLVPVAELTATFDPSRAGRGQIATVTPGAGAAYDPATGMAQIAVAGGPIDVFLGSPARPGGLTQLDSPFAPTAISSNGAAAGNLTGVEIDDSGFLRGVYDSGQRLTLYRIPVVDVPNPNGLAVLDNQTFGITQASGAAYLWDANTGPVGGIEGFSLQESTVDIARELTGLIQTQRAYSSNATVIRTVDEMLQETTNLKR